jgi:uncharacterized protein (TIGR04141 family)
MRLTMYLLRDGSTGDSSVLRETTSYAELALRPEFESIAAAFFISGEAKGPSWLTDLNLVADISTGEENLLTRSLGAVILVSVRERIVAVTFGTGFHAIRPAFIERGFGLRVTANLISMNKIRGSQTRGVAGNSRDQKTLLPVDGQFGDLNVEVDEDWLRQLSGKSSDPSVASSLSGSDSLRITVPNFSLSNLAEKLDQVVAVYGQQEYRARFPFLDQITPIDKSDPLIEDLDALVDQQLRAHDQSVAFAAPDPFDQGDVDHYELTAQYARYVLQDLDNAGVFSVVENLDPDKSPIEDVRVFALDADDNLADRAQSLKAYVQTEVALDGRDYLLSAGLWFAIQDDFVEQINRQIAAIPDITDELNLPRWNAEELKDDPSDTSAEGSYNIQTSTQRGYALLDKKLVIFGRNERLEMCDLLTENAEFLCVKTASSSPTLSHLVAQAVDSAAAWGALEYQRKLAGVWEELKGADAVLPSRAEATFVLAIATPKNVPLSESLFFFTKVQIANCYRLITRQQFKFALARIDLVPAPVEKKARKRKVSFEPSEGD